MLRHLRRFLNVILVGVIVTCVLLLFRGSRTGDSGAAQALQAGAADAERLAEGQILIEDFLHPLHNPETGKTSGQITGKEAVLDTETQRYTIYEPSIVSTLEEQEKGEGPGDVFVRAERAELEPARGEASLRGSVVVEGKNFRIDTDRVSYRVFTRSIHTDADAALRWFREKATATARPVIVITGTGIDGELVAQRAKILKNPRVLIAEAGAGLFADASAIEKEGGDGAERASPIVIECEGSLTYEHLTGNATFRNGVTVTSGKARLRCDLLVVQLQAEGQGVNVKRLDAIGNARLDWEGTSATAGYMQWQRVTQTTLLRATREGRVVIRRDGIEIAGKRMFFYQMDRRVDIDGAGTLKRTAPGREGKLGTEVHVSWQNAMTYDSRDRHARFTGDVTVRSGPAKLTARELQFALTESGTAIEEFTASDDVVIVMEGDAAEGRVPVRGYGTSLNWQALEAPKQEPEGEPKTGVAGGLGLFTLKGTEKAPARIESGSHWIRAASIQYDQSRQSFLVSGEGSLHALVSDDPRRPFPEIVDIQWSRKLVYATGKTVTADFRGDVRARRPGQNVTCDHLTVTFRPMDGRKDAPEGRKPEMTAALEVEKIAAEGNVRMTQAPVSAGVREDQPPARPAPGPQRGLWVVAAQRLTLFPQERRVACDSPGTLELQQPGSEGDKWLKIKWEKAMALDAAKGQAVFTGRTASIFSGAAVLADQLTVRFDDGQALRKIQGEGNVRFLKELEGRAGKPGGRLTVTAGKMAADFGTAEGSRYLQSATALGDVHVDDPGYTLDCERLELIMVVGAKKAGGAGLGLDLRSAKATGEHVKVVQKGASPVQATGNELLWDHDPDKGVDRYELTGKPFAVLQQHGMRVRHRKIVVDRINNVITTMGGPGAYTGDPVEREGR
jgi:lipopolysaccharide export system protein LptA